MEGRRESAHHSHDAGEVGRDDSQVARPRDDARTTALVLVSKPFSDPWPLTEPRTTRLINKIPPYSIDEVHSVGSDRGAVLEVVVSRMKTLGTSTRFVAVSATVPNIADVAEWLGTSCSRSRRRATTDRSLLLGSDSADDKPAEVFQFGDDFRPCKLQKCASSRMCGSESEDYLTLLLQSRAGLSSQIKRFRVRQLAQFQAVRSHQTVLFRETVRHTYRPQSSV